MEPANVGVMEPLGVMEPEPANVGVMEPFEPFIERRALVSRLGAADLDWNETCVDHASEVEDPRGAFCSFGVAEHF